MLALKPIGLNEQTIKPEDGFIDIKPSDKLHFFCVKCVIPHLYFVCVPSDEFQPTVSRDTLYQQQKLAYQTI
jgi:hypothetical protein